MTEEVEPRAVLKSRELQRKFEDLREHLKEEVRNSVSDKEGTSAVTRMAIRMAHDQMKELQEEQELSAKEFKRIRKQMEEYAENI